MKNMIIFIKSMEQKIIKQFCYPVKASNHYIGSLLMSILLMLLGTQCKKESSDINDSNSKLTPRINASCWNNTQSDSTVSGTFQPGSYTIVNNCIRFTNYEEFNKTELFLNHATASEIDSWYNSLPMQTSEKAYQDFMDQYNCNDSISISEINNLLNAYGNTIRYSWINQDEISISPKFMTFAGYRNMDGNFMIGDQIEAESEGVRV